MTVSKMLHLIFLVQSLPEIDFEKWGSFALALMLLIWFVSFLIKDRNHYRKKVEEKENAHQNDLKEIRKEHDDHIQNLISSHRERLEQQIKEKERLHAERQQETKATIEALKETKKILQEQLQGYK